MLNLKKEVLVSIILILFLLLIGYISYSNFKYQPITKGGQEVALEVLKEQELGEPINVTGIVEKVYKSKEGILNISVTDSNSNIVVSMFPSFGLMHQELKMGDKIQVQGLLTKYKEQFQVQPFSKESIVLLDRNIENLDLSKVALSEVQDFIDQKVWFGPIRVSNFNTYESSSGKTHLQMNLTDGNESIEAIMFEGEWSQEDLELIESEETLNIVATVDEYNDEYTLNVHELYEEEGNTTLQESNQIEKERKNTVPLSQVDSYSGETIHIGPLSIKNVEYFTSNAGKQHLRFTVRQQDVDVDAIMFDGEWAQSDIDLINSSKMLYITAKVDSYNNKTSLIVEEIEE